MAILGASVALHLGSRLELVSSMRIVSKSDHTNCRIPARTGTYKLDFDKRRLRAALTIYALLPKRQKLVTQCRELKAGLLGPRVAVKVQQRLDRAVHCVINLDFRDYLGCASVVNVPNAKLGALTAIGLFRLSQIAHWKDVVA